MKEAKIQGLNQLKNGREEKPYLDDMQKESEILI